MNRKLGAGAPCHALRGEDGRHRSHPEVAVQAAATGGDEVKFRLLAGCSGWGPEQLEGELKRADWHSLPATAELVFDHDPHELWDVLIKQAQEANKLLPKLKGDAALN